MSKCLLAIPGVEALKGTPASGHCQLGSSETGLRLWIEIERDMFFLVGVSAQAC